MLSTDKPAGREEVGAIVLAGEGSFVLGGTSGASASGDKSEASRGYIDYWVV